jgi:hypothetical protein
MRLPVRKSNRLSGYDYSRDGRYFFTSNVKDFRRFFGEINNGQMVLNPFGIIVAEQWAWMCGHFPYVMGVRLSSCRIICMASWRLEEIWLEKHISTRAISQIGR